MKKLIYLLLLIPIASFSQWEVYESKVNGNSLFGLHDGETDGNIPAFFKSLSKDQGGAYIANYNGTKCRINPGIYPYHLTNKEFAVLENEGKYGIAFSDENFTGFRFDEIYSFDERDDEHFLYLKEGDSLKMLDITSGKQLFAVQGDRFVLDLYTMDDFRLVLFDRNGKQGAIDAYSTENISMVIAPFIEFDYISQDYESEGHIFYEVVKKKKRGLVNDSVFVPAMYNWCEPGFEPGYIYVKKGKRYGFYNYNGDLIVPPDYSSVEYSYDPIDNPFFLITKGKKYGAIDGKGKELISPVFDNIFFNEAVNLIDLEKKGKHGWYYNGSCINPEFESLVESGLENYVIVMNGELMGLAKKTGELVIPVEYEDLFLDSEPWYGIKNDEKIILKDLILE